MTLDILICTYNGGIGSCEAILNAPHPQIRYKISHQITDEIYRKIPEELLCRKDVEISQISSKGLSKNRNNALSMAKSELCIIADDDVRYDIQNLESLIEWYEKSPEVDVILGKIETYDNEPEYKEYPVRPHTLSKKDIGGVSSIEISFRLKSVRDNAINFDERFGLCGSLFEKGEECIFLSDCLDNGLKLQYIPQYVVKHPKLSSTSGTLYDSNEATYYGALSYRIFSKLVYSVLPIFIMKHHNRYIQHITITKYIKSFLTGIDLIKKTKK